MLAESKTYFQNDLTKEMQGKQMWQKVENQWIQIKVIEILYCDSFVYLKFQTFQDKKLENMLNDF